MTTVEKMQKSARKIIERLPELAEELNERMQVVVIPVEGGGLVVGATGDIASALLGMIDGLCEDFKQGSVEDLEAQLAVARYLLSPAFGAVKSKPCKCPNCTAVTSLFDGTAGRRLVERQRGYEIVLKEVFDNLRRTMVAGHIPMEKVAEMAGRIQRELGPISRHVGQGP
jgi:hypothetical protein